MSIDNLRDLAQTMVATNPHPDSWAWFAGDDYDEPGAYIDCSRRGDGTYSLEVGDGEDATVIHVSTSDLAEIHKQLTVQLMVARMKDERSHVDGCTTAANATGDHRAAGNEAAADDCDGM